MRDPVTRSPGDAAAPLDTYALRLARVVLLMASDVGALLLSGSLAYCLWAWPVKGQPAAMYVELVPLVFLFALGYAQLGLYPGFGIGPVETLRRLTYVTSFAFLVLAAFSFALKVPHLYSRVTFVIAFVLSLVLVPVMRVGMLAMARRWRRWSEPVAVIGTEQGALSAAQSLNRTNHIGFRPVAVLALDLSDDGTALDALPVFGGLAAAPKLASRGIRVALLAPHEQQSRATVDLLLRHFRHVILLREYDDLPVEGLQIRNLGSLVGVEYTNNLLLHSNQIFKRAIDIVLGTTAFVLFLPLIGFFALLVRLFDGAPSFYAQRRPGLGGRDVSVSKLRTMRRDADKHLESCLAANPALREEWQTTYKLRDDPRLIPALGRFFRRCSIDELPQLWAVVRGSMSLVGPRPFPDYHLERFPAEFVELRQRVRPGITGLWQVTVRSGGTIEEQQAYDTYYIRNWSVWLDVYILSRTLAAVFTGRGAF